MKVNLFEAVANYMVANGADEEQVAEELATAFKAVVKHGLCGPGEIDLPDATYIGEFKRLADVVEVKQ